MANLLNDPGNPWTTTRRSETFQGDVFKSGPSHFERAVPQVAAELNERIRRSAQEALNAKLDETFRRMHDVSYPPFSLRDEPNVSYKPVATRNTIPPFLGGLMPFNGVVLTNLPAILEFNPNDYPDDGLMFVIVQLGGVARNYEADFPDNPKAQEKVTAIRAKMQDCHNVIKQRADDVLRRQAAHLQAQYDKLYEQVHSEAKLEAVKAELDALKAQLAS